MTKEDEPTQKNIIKSQKDKELSGFGSRDLIISSDSKKAAEQDVKKLEIRKKYHRMIINGKMPEKKGDVLTPLDSQARAALNVMVALIKADYSYKTIRSIYLNEHLMCYYKLRDKTEDDLKKDVLEALHLVRTEEFKGTSHKRAIAHIKGLGHKREEEVRRISKYILHDLITGDEAAGKGFYNEDRRIPYFFNSEEKTLMDVESDEFYFYVRDRYDIPKKDYDPEVKDTIRAHIHEHEKRIEAYMFAYFDKNKHILYVSDHDNGIYHLDGNRIKHVDNGTDGVFFEFNSDFTPFDIDVENLEGARYFEKEIEGIIPLKEGVKIKLPKRKVFGLNWYKFIRGNSLLCRYLLDIASFAETEKNVAVADQKLLLVVYFYSLFFESIMTEKPIICFVGLKDSGKSTIGSLIGKILFGDKFQCRHCPEDVKDLNTIIGENYYMVFDNVDNFVKSKIIDSLCVAATGGTIEARKLYYNRETVKIRPHVYLGITTREAKFKRDDLISRLILFNTEKITKRIQKGKFYRDIEENRNKIMEEVLLNLNPIVALLKRLKDFSPICTFRVADWETFGRKICVAFPWSLYFQLIMDVMNEEKDIFALEDDPLFFLLKDRVIDKRNAIEALLPSELYLELMEDAEELKMKDYFGKKYKSPISLGKRIGNIQDELRRVFDVEIRNVAGNKKLYSFRPLTEEEPEEQEEVELKDKLDNIRMKARIGAYNTEEKKREPTPEEREKIKKEYKKKADAIRAKHRPEKEKNPQKTGKS